MSALLARMRCESGQAIVFVTFALFGLVLMAALVIDGGSFFRAQRQVQTAADAAALAGAQDLPSRGAATNSANNYADENWEGIPAPTVTFSDTNDWIDVVAAQPVTGLFMQGLGLSATARAHARASREVFPPLTMKNVAPIAVKDTAACFFSNPGCFGQTVTVSFDESDISSSTIGLVDLRCQSDVSAFSCGGGPGGDKLAEWIDDGYVDALPSNKWYDVKTGQTLGPIRHALDDAADEGRMLFFPVFDEADGPNSSFHVIGWAAFVIDSGGVTWGSHTKTLTGHFVTYITTDLAPDGANPDGPDFGLQVPVIKLTQ